MFHCIREGRVILERLHWEVQENEQWVILGLNGSGKTSLLNILLGYEYYLSETFQIDVHVRWEHNRPWVSIKKPCTSVNRKIKEDERRKMNEKREENFTSMSVKKPTNILEKLQARLKISLRIIRFIQTGMELLSKRIKRNALSCS